MLEVESSYTRSASSASTAWWGVVDKFAAEDRDGKNTRKHKLYIQDVVIFLTPCGR